MINMSGSVDQSMDVIQQNQKSKRVYSYEIQNMFLDIAKRIDENSLYALKKFIPIEEIIYEINDTEPVLLIQYIKQIIFYLSKVKMELEDKVQRQPEEEDQTNYETLIQKLEAEVRQHIRIEQQQRLHIENLQQKLEETLFKNQDLEDEVGYKQQELKALNQRLFNFESEYYLKVESQPDSTSRIQKSSDRIVKNLNKVQKVNQTNYINNIHVSQIQPRQIQSSNESSLPSSLQHHSHSGHKMMDKSNEHISSQAAKRNNNKSLNNPSVQQLPLQLKALFKKVYNEREPTQTQSRSQQSKTNLSKISSSKNKNDVKNQKLDYQRSYETTHKEDQMYHAKMTESQDEVQGEQGQHKRLFSNGQKQIQTARIKEQDNVNRNLESQFLETDRMREELFKQFGQTQYTYYINDLRQNAYLSHRVNQNNTHKMQKDDNQKNSKDQILLQKSSRIEKKVQFQSMKDNTRQELSKSSSFDGTQNKMVKVFRRDIKANAQILNSNQKSAHNIVNYVKKLSPPL